MCAAEGQGNWTVLHAPPFSLFSVGKKSRYVAKHWLWRAGRQRRGRDA